VRVESKPWFVYVDESGDPGFDFSRERTSKHLTIAVVATQNQIALKRLVRRTRETIGLSRADELKGGVTPHRVQLEMLASLAKIPVRIRAFTVYKPNVYETLRRDANIFYNYCAGNAVIPVIKEVDEAIVYWDARQLRTGARLALDAYIKYRLWVEERCSTRVYIHHVDSKAVAGIQVVDVVAHAVFTAWERGQWDLCRCIASRLSANDRWFFEPRDPGRG
jgi:hypothetical protein